MVRAERRKRAGHPQGRHVTARELRECPLRRTPVGDPGRRVERTATRSGGTSDEMERSLPTAAGRRATLASGHHCVVSITGSFSFNTGTIRTTRTITDTTTDTGTITRTIYDLRSTFYDCTCQGCLEPKCVRDVLSLYQGSPARTASRARTRSRSRPAHDRMSARSPLVRAPCSRLVRARALFAPAPCSRTTASIRSWVRLLLRPTAKASAMRAQVRASHDVLCSAHGTRLSLERA